MSLAEARLAERLIASGRDKTTAAKILRVSRRTIDSAARCRLSVQKTAAQYTRCPECGALVLLPCLLCALRAK